MSKGSPCWHWPLLPGAAASVPQLFSIALEAACVPSEMALRSQEAFFLFSFLKDNFPDIALESKGGIHSYKLSPCDGGRPWVFWIAGPWIFGAGGGWCPRGPSLAVLGHRRCFITSECAPVLSEWIWILDLQQALPHDTSFQPRDEVTRTSPRGAAAGAGLGYTWH